MTTLLMTLDLEEPTKRSINGLPKITAPQTMVSFNINLPEKVVDHGG